MTIEKAGLCNGSTTDSDSVCEGSNPSPAATEKPCSLNDYRVFLLLLYAYRMLVFDDLSLYRWWKKWWKKISIYALDIFSIDTFTALNGSFIHFRVR